MENKFNITDEIRQSILEQLNVGVVVMDENLHPVYVNAAAARILNIQPADSEDTDKKPDPYLLQRIEQLPLNSREMVNVEREGRNMELALNANHLILDSQRLKSVTLRDISIELTDRELQSWNKVIRVLNHDIMNAVIPLSTLTNVNRGILEEIQAGYQIIANSPSEEESGEEKILDVIEGMKVIEHRSRVIARLARDTQRFLGISEPNYRKINLNELLNRVYKYLLPSINHDGISFVPELPNESVFAMGDFEMVEQALINILRNAQDALSSKIPTRDPTIQLALTKKEGLAIIEIKDNGPGICKGDMDNIFVPFFTTKNGNTGLGLAMARKIIRLNHGALSVHTEENKKTNFVIRFHQA